MRQGLRLPAVRSAIQSKLVPFLRRGPPGRPRDRVPEFVSGRLGEPSLHSQSISSSSTSTSTGSVHVVAVLCHLLLETELVFVPINPAAARATALDAGCARRRHLDWDCAHGVNWMWSVNEVTGFV